MSKSILGILLIFFCAQAAPAQSYDLNPQHWYPLELGNYWVYRNVGTSVDYDSRHVIATTRDTLVEGERWTLFELIYSTLPLERTYAAAPLGWQRFSEDYYLLQTSNFTHIDTLWKTLPRSFFTASTPSDTTLEVVFQYPGQAEWHREAATIYVDTTYYRNQPCCRPDSTNFLLRADLWEGAHTVYNVQFVYNLGHIFSGQIYNDKMEGALVNGRTYGNTSLINSIRLPVEDVEMLQPMPKLDVYPTPAIEEITARIEAAASGLHEVRVFNVLGQQVYYENRWMRAGDQERFSILDVGLASGMYIIHVRDTVGRTASAQVIVAR